MRKWEIFTAEDIHRILVTSLYGRSFSLDDAVLMGIQLNAFLEEKAFWFKGVEKDNGEFVGETTRSTDNKFTHEGLLCRPRPIEICEHRNRKIIDNSTTYTSHPAQYDMNCLDCGKIFVGRPIEEDVEECKCVKIIRYIEDIERVMPNCKVRDAFVNFCSDCGKDFRE